MTPSNRVSTVVGAVVLALLGIGIVAGASLLRGAGVLQPRVKVRVAFADIAGLREGAPVRLAGLDVGVVDRISIAGDAPRHEVVLAIVDRPELRRWIREDSRIEITADNLLGSKHVAIGFGSTGKPLGHGDLVVGSSPIGFEAILADLRSTVRSTAEVGARFEKAIALIDGPDGGGLARSLVQIQTALADLAKVGAELRAVFDPERGDPNSLRNTLADLRKAARSAAELTGEINKALAGEGGGKKLGDLIASLERTVANTERVTAELRLMLAGDPAAGPPANIARTLKDLEKTAANLKEITESTKGTIEVMRKLYPPNWFK